jgi:hypothetical protein
MGDCVPGWNIMTSASWSVMTRGAAPGDSTLAWFVDVRCRGEALPSVPEDVREWFLSRSGLIQPAFRQLAQELGTGIDSDWPLKRPIPATDGNDMAIYCSAIRRLSGREIAAVLADLATKWPALVRELPDYSSSVPANA